MGSVFRLLNMPMYFQPHTQKIDQCVSVLNFLLFNVFDCYTLHSMPIFLFVRHVVRAVFV